MRKITIEGTALQVTRWSFGTGSLHHVFSTRQRLNVLGLAADSGFTHFDTSPLYGSGLAEVDLGRFLQGRRDRITIATKVGLYPAGGTVGSVAALWAQRALRKLRKMPGIAEANWCVEVAERSLDASLRRLRSHYVDLLLLHEPDPSVINAEEFLRWMELEVVRGRVRFWGLAGVGVAQLTWAVAGHPLAQILQAKDSLHDNAAAARMGAGKPAQFTYGYLAGMPQPLSSADLQTTLAAVLRRNTRGSIIIATREPNHLFAFVRAADSESCA